MNMDTTFFDFYTNIKYYISIKDKVGMAYDWGRKVAHACKRK